MSASHITFPTVTGVDIQLRIAGPGSRSYAFLIDWHIRLLLSVAWFLIVAFGGGLLSNLNSFEDIAFGNLLLWAVLPAVLINLLYHPVLEAAMRGRTPGKRIAGVRLITRDGDIPGVGAIVLRNVFRLIDNLPFAYLLGLTVVFFTKQHVRIGDLAAGTLLVFEQDNTASSFAVARSVQQGGVDPKVADLVHELLERWNALQPEQRASIARSLLTRVEPTTTAEELQQLDQAALRAKLAALVGE